MDAKTELITALCGLFPGHGEQVQELFKQYTVTRGSDSSRYSLKKRIEHFISSKRIDGLSAKTLKEYGCKLKLFAQQTDKHVSKITADDIRDYIGYLARERKLKESSIQTHINTLRSFFSWLDAEDIIRKNPMRKIKSARLDRRNARRPLTSEELEQLREGCRTYKEKALMEFLVSSGCRLSEAAGIRLSQINWRERSVVVLGKGNKERTVYFSVRAKMMMDEYIRRRRGGTALFAGSRRPYDAMKPRAIQKALQKIGEQSGQSRRIHPHLMRHTFATNALNGGMDITVIQRLLGHTDPKTTLIYAELFPRTIQYEYERIVA